MAMRWPILVLASAAADASPQPTEHVRLSFAPGFPHGGRRGPGALAEGRCSVAFSARGKDFCLRLALNSALLPRGYAAFASGAEGPQRVDHRPLPCHYMGSARDDPYSSVGLSMCNGRLSAAVFAHGEELGLRGAAGELVEVTDYSPPQLPFGAALDPSVNSLAAIARIRSGRQKNSTAPRRRASPQAVATKYVEVLAVHDYAHYIAHGSSGTPSQADMTAMLDKTASILNQVTAIYQAPPDSGAFTVTIQLVLVATWTFVAADPYDANVVKVGSESDADSLLENFREWYTEMGTLLPDNDNAVLLSGRDFTGTVAGYAGVGTMCAGSRSSSVNMCSSEASCVVIIAHEMGHNFGMEHDSKGGCTDDFVMAATGSYPRPDKFSKCSVDYLADWLASVYPGRDCLENKPTRVYGHPTCGNGFIEDGEECDCGHSDCSGRAPCCNGATCRFRDPRYQCSTGVCCEGCFFVPASARKTCRAKRGDCDLDELCPGGQEECPKDAHVYQGSPCVDAGYAGLCYGGECMNVGKECKVSIAQQSKKAYGMTDHCRTKNDACGLLYCHLDGDSDTQCWSGFYVDGQKTHVPNGSPCPHPAHPSGTRDGQCLGGRCRVAGAGGDLAHCGNGAIDWGEECDCGKGGDPCCDCSTCRLAAGSLCATSEPCCTSNCRFEDKGTVCRTAVDSECDLVETCSGSSGICPPDAGRPLGTACLAGTAANGTDEHRASNCYAQRCVTGPHLQCVAQGQQWSNWGYKHNAGLRDSTCIFNLCCHKDGAWTRCASIRGAPDGIVFDSSSAEYCLRGEPATREPASNCTAAEYYAEAAAACVPCHDACSRGCSGPSASDCTACAYGADTRGVCATKLQWQNRASTNAALPGASQTTSQPSAGPTGSTSTQARALPSATPSVSPSATASPDSGTAWPSGSPTAPTAAPTVVPSLAPSARAPSASPSTTAHTLLLPPPPPVPPPQSAPPPPPSAPPSQPSAPPPPPPQPSFSSATAAPSQAASLSPATTASPVPAAIVPPATLAAAAVAAEPVLSQLAAAPVVPAVSVDVVAILSVGTYSFSSHAGLPAVALTVVAVPTTATTAANTQVSVPALLSRVDVLADPAGYKASAAYMFAQLLGVNSAQISQLTITFTGGSTIGRRGAVLSDSATVAYLLCSSTDCGSSSESEENGGGGSSGGVLVYVAAATGGVLLVVAVVVVYLCCRNGGGDKPGPRELEPISPVTSPTSITGPTENAVPPHLGRQDTSKNPFGRKYSAAASEHFDRRACAGNLSSAQYGGSHNISANYPTSANYGDAYPSSACFSPRSTGSPQDLVQDQSAVDGGHMEDEGAVPAEQCRAPLPPDTLHDSLGPLRELRKTRGSLGDSAHPDPPC